MDTTLQSTGSSLEVLQAYPLGTLEVCRVSDHFSILGRVVGLSAPGCVEVAHQHGAAFYEPADILPRLKPFSALCTPLEDRTVPAVEVAKMLFDNMLGEGTGNIDAGFDHFGNVVVAESGVRLLCIYPGWLMSVEDGLFAGPAEYDYLRKLHFAVGLQPHQFIPKP